MNMSEPEVTQSDRTLSQEEFDDLMISLVTRMRETGRSFKNVYAMETGKIPAQRMSKLLNLPIIEDKNEIELHTVVVYTVSESGSSFRKLKEEVGDFYSVALVMNYHTGFVPHIYGLLRKNKWIRFPWQE